MILMSAISAASIATASSFLIFVFVPNLIKSSAAAQSVEVILWLTVAFWIFFRQFRWVTVFCYVEDCERELKHGPSEYGFMLKHSSSFPLFLKYLDTLAGWFEKHNRADILRILEARPGAQAGKVGENEAQKSST